MTKEDIIGFYKENRQNAPLNELGQKILEAVRAAYLARVIVEDPSANPDPDFEVQSLCNSSVETLNLGEEMYFDQLEVYTLRGTFFFILEELIAPLNEIGDSTISWKIKNLEDSMDKLMLQLGEIQETADKIKQKWNVKKKSRVEGKTR
jgi:hypothetical protein